MLRNLLLAGVVLALGVSPLFGQVDARARLQELENATSLTRPGVSPWHIKASFQVYDLAGNPSEKGTLEEWWASDDASKIVITSPSVNVTFPGVDRSGPTSRELFLIRQLLSDIVNPLPSRKNIDALQVELHPQTFGKVSLDCLTLSTPDIGPIGTLPVNRFCTEPGTVQLRMQSTMYSEFVRNSNGKFMGVEVALDHSLAYDGRVAITGRLEKLEAWNRDKDPQQLTDGSTDNGEVRPLVTFGKPIWRAPPEYPSLAHDQHLAGAVILFAKVGMDGKVSDIGTIASPGPVLTGAATNALSQWVFKPFTVNGKTVDSWTSFTFNFVGRGR